MTKTRISVEGRFVFGKNTSRDELIDMLRKARKDGSIHDIAKILREGRRRKMPGMDLTATERSMLVAALIEARYGAPTGRSAWIPRGYKIAEALSAVKDMMPGFYVCIRDEDIAFMKRAIQAFKKKKDVWGDEVVEFVISTAKQIGVPLA